MTRRAIAGLATLLVACAAVTAVNPSPAVAAVTAGVKPDFVLNPNAPPQSRRSTGVLVNDPTPLGRNEGIDDEDIDPLVPVPTPDQCRTAAYDEVCDVWRIRVNPTSAPGARNFVVVRVDWDGVNLGDLDLVVVGLGLGYLPDLDMFLYKDRETYVPATNIGGRGVTIPERLAFTATQREYDVVVRAGTGVLATGYTIQARMTDELFGQQPELLDDTTPAPVDHSSDVSPVIGVPPASPGTQLPNLALAPIDTDSQIAGIGLGTNEQFAGDDLLRLARAAARTTATTGPPPSGFVLLITMLLLPLAVGAAAVVVLRRRRNAFVT